MCKQAPEFIPESKRIREIEKSKEEYLAREILAKSGDWFRLVCLTVATPDASLRQIVNRALVNTTGHPIHRYRTR